MTQLNFSKIADNEIVNSFKSLERTIREKKQATIWNSVHSICSEEDFDYIIELAKGINNFSFQHIVVDFFQQILYFKQKRKKNITEYFNKVDKNWYKNPFYYTYVQYFGTDRSKEGSFDTLTEMLPYLENLGIKNIYILPHYESPGGDNGYDVSSFNPAKSLGGKKAYNRFMKEVIEKEFHIVSDAVFNHVSIEHEWFKKAENGEQKYLDYFLMVDDWKYIGEEERDGKFWVKYSDGDGNIMERILISQEVSRNHYIEFEVNGKKRKVYREFYPFEVDLNLQNHNVIWEMWNILGEEINEGILGKRTDAIAHWMKPRGAKGSDGNKETFFIHKLIKAFLKFSSNKTVIIPEAVKDIEISKKYIGEEITLNNEKTTDQGDIMFNYQAQGALLESLCFEECDPWWEYWGKKHIETEIPDNASWLNLLGHDDDIYMEFIRESSRKKFKNFVVDPNSGGGKIFKGGMSGGARLGNCLNKNHHRIAMAYFLLYMIPGIPSIYYGDEIGWCNNYPHAQKQEKKMKNYLSKLKLDKTKKDFFDPRELQRGPIRKDLFEKKLGYEYLPVKTIIKLNELWKAKAAVRSPHLHDLPCSDNGIIAMEKFVKSEKISNDFPVLAIANLTRTEKTAEISKKEFSFIIQHHKGQELVFNQLAGINFEKNNTNVKYPFKDNKLIIKLKPYEFLLLGKKN